MIRYRRQSETRDGPAQRFQIWGHQFDFVHFFRSMFWEHSNVPRTWNAFTSSLGQDLDRLLLVERHRALELRRPDAGVNLGGVDARMSQERADLLEVVMLLEDFHCDTVAQVMRLELGVADHLVSLLKKSSGAINLHSAD